MITFKSSLRAFASLVVCSSLISCNLKEEKKDETAKTVAQIKTPEATEPEKDREAQPPEAAKPPLQSPAEVPTIPEGDSSKKLLDPKPASLPSEIVIEAHFEKMVRISPKDSGEDLAAILEGKILVDSLEPKIDRPLRLDQAEKSTFVSNSDLGECVLSINNYKIETDNSSLVFTFVGVDKKTEMNEKGCVARLSTFAMAGFTVEFTNVPIGGALSQDVIAKVVLKVQSKE